MECKPEFGQRRHSAFAGFEKAQAGRHAELRAHRGALAAVAAFDPLGWNVVRFQLWDRLLPNEGPAGPTGYSVGHVSTA